MQLHAATAFELVGVVKSAPREWIPPQPKASLELYRMACGVDGFSSGIALLQFRSYLDKLSQDSGCSMSALENMCCKLKVSASVNGQWPWPNGQQPRCKHTSATTSSRVPLVFKLEPNIAMQPNVPQCLQSPVHGGGLAFDPSEAKHWTIPMLERTQLPKNGSWVVRDPQQAVAAVGGPVRCSRLHSLLVRQTGFQPRGGR